MLVDRHTVLPQEIEPVPLTRSDVGKAGDLRDAPNVPRGSMGRRTRRSWYVAAAAGAILILRRCSPASEEASMSFKPGVSIEPGLIECCGDRHCLRHRSRAAELSLLEVRRSHLW